MAAVALDLPADRGRRTAQLARDLADRRLLPHPIGDVDALVDTQVASGGGPWRPLG
jgi:hypothetical protein